MKHDWIDIITIASRHHSRVLVAQLDGVQHISLIACPEREGAYGCGQGSNPALLPVDFDDALELLAHGIGVLVMYGFIPRTLRRKSRNSPAASSGQTLCRLRIIYTMAPRYSFYEEISSNNKWLNLITLSSGRK